MPHDDLAEWQRFKSAHPPGTHLSGSVKHVAAFGVFLDLGVPFAALLELPQFNKPLPFTAEDYPRVGESLDVMIHSYSDDVPGGRPGQINLTQKPAK